jgi:uncharacterized RDD family membrane protein YckC
VGYVGLVTRIVAFGLDVVVVNLVVVLVGGVLNLIATLVGDKSGLTSIEAILGGVVWWLWIVAYFVTFWTLTGQTLGNRIMGIRVENAAGGAIRLRQALRRFAGSVLAAIPFGAGFLLVLFDDRRRGLQDRIGGTVVRWHAAEAYGRPEPSAVSVPASASAPLSAAAPAPSPVPPGIETRPTA